MASGLRLLVFAVSVALSLSACSGGGTLSLAGKWKLKVGGDALPEGKFDGEVELPGSMQSQGYGKDVSADTKWIGRLKDTSWLEHSGKQADGSFKVAGWLQPRKHYVGKVWYSRGIDVPSDWAGRRILLFLERPHVATTVYLDGREIGFDDSLSAPHVHDLGKPKPGKHVLTILVDNDLPAPVGVNAHCVTDHTQTAWNGVVGKIELRAVPDKYIDYVMAFPDVKGKKVDFKVFLAGRSEASGGELTISVTPPKGHGETRSATLDVPNGAVAEASVSFAETALWDEFEPNIYKVAVKLVSSSGVEQECHTQFGFYDKKIEGQEFVVNGRPTLFRGTLDCASFPLTGYPSTDKGYWLNVFGVCKSMGLNHVRYHSWTPPEAAFAAADEVGIYLQCEHAWAKLSNEDVLKYLMKETKRVIERFGNHPSFMLAAYGNEPGGGRKGNGWLGKWVDFTRKVDGDRKFYTSAAGWGTSSNSDYYDVMRGMRVYPWGAGLNSSVNKNAPEFASDFSATPAKTPGKPYIGHESGQWCVYPDFEEMKLYTGFLKPENYSIFKKNLEDAKMFSRWREFFNASGKLQTLCYKFEIEKLRRTKGCGGYQLLGINDFPGQGTALVGPVNVFWKVKSYTSPEEYGQFNGPTAILARMPKFVFKSGERVSFDIELSHYGEKPMESPVLEWRVESSGGKTLASGSETSSVDAPLGLSTLKKEFVLDTKGLPSPGQYVLKLDLKDSKVENHYDFWVYPGNAGNAPVGDVVVAKTPGDALAALGKGRKVLLVPSEELIVQPASRPPVMGFSTIFWNTVWANRQPPTVMGVCFDSETPLFENFPTEGHSDFQWWYVMSKTEKPLWLDKWIGGGEPMVGVVDDWFTCRNLGLLVEAKVGEGKLLVSAVPIADPVSDNMVLGQLRDAVLKYMNSDAFAPKDSMTPKELLSMVCPDTPPLEVKKVELKGGGDASSSVSNVIDGNPDTAFAASTGYPYVLDFELANVSKVFRVVFLQKRGASREKVGMVEVYLSSDGSQWGEPVARSVLGENRSGLGIENARAVKFIRVKLLSPLRGKRGKSSALAEIVFH